MPIKRVLVELKEDVVIKRREEEMQELIKEQLRKEYIRPSKSPQMASVFFIGKKNGKK